jgi:glycerophosphoryl diester phosphodiesterase
MAFFATVPQTRVYIEIKQKTTAATVAQLIRAAGRVQNTWITSFTDYVHSIAPDIRLNLKNFTTTLPSPSSLVTRGVSVLSLLPAQITASNVDSYHAVGIEVQDRDANTSSEWQNTIAAGADGQLTDFPDQLESYCPSARK